MHMYEKKSIMPTVLFLAFNSVSWGDLSTEHTHLPCFFYSCVALLWVDALQCIHQCPLDKH